MNPKLILSGPLPLLPQPLLVLMPNSRQRHDNAHPARRQRDQVRILVAVHTIRAIPLTIRAHHTMAVKDGAVKQVEDVARDGGRERHEAPVLAQAVDAERLGHDGGEHEAVAEARQARHEAEDVRVRDADGAELGDAEDDAGEDEAPRAVGVQDFDEEVGADAWGGMLVLGEGGWGGGRAYRLVGDRRNWRWTKSRRAFAAGRRGRQIPSPTD